MTEVYKAIAAVQGALAKTGIAKDRNNQQQGYKYRGIDDVYSALAPLLAAHGLCIFPRVLSRTITERTTQKGGVLFYVVLDTEFDFVASSDGSKHTIRVVGEAMDSADKASNKAMSAAYKYACLMVFCIPTEGLPDADELTHEVQPTGRLNQWLDAIESATDALELERLGKELAAGAVSGPDKAQLRQAFAKRKDELRAAA